MSWGEIVGSRYTLKDGDFGPFVFPGLSDKDFTVCNYIAVNKIQMFSKLRRSMRNHPCLRRARIAGLLLTSIQANDEV